MKTLLLKKEEVSRLISNLDVIEAVEDAYKAFSSGDVEQPEYLSFHLPPPRGEIDFKLGYYKVSETISMKASSGDFKKTLKALDCRAAWGRLFSLTPGVAP